jgi:hypothetical protein
MNRIEDALKLNSENRLHCKRFLLKDSSLALPCLDG